jgi:glycosyltransferase involved in cell wall biosynthesis
MISSEWQKKYLVDELHGDADKIQVVPNYVETNLFRPFPELTPKNDLCFLGRDDNQKNLPALLEAMVLLKNRGINLSLRMIGSSAESKWVQKVVYDNELTVHMDPFVEHTRIPVLFNESRIFVLPSFYEGHPKALLEAMSCGRPCIGADVSGIREEIEDGVDGLLCRPEARSISEQIIRLLDNDSLAAELGKRARMKIVSRYRIDLVAEMEWRILADLMKQPQ